MLQNMLFTLETFFFTNFDSFTLTEFGHCFSVMFKNVQNAQVCLVLKLTLKSIDMPRFMNGLVKSMTVSLA